jgi:phosphonate transport system permease protein
MIMTDSTNPTSLDEILISIWFSTRWFIFFGFLFWLTMVVADGMVDDWGRLNNGGANLIIFIEESLWPPDWSVLEPQSYPPCVVAPGFQFTCSTAWIGLVETLQIAFVSTVLGTVISLPISLLAARNLNSFWVSFPARFILSASRSLPSIIWAIFFVILVGLGPLSGILAMTVYTIGYLGKLQYEAIEGISREPLDASLAMGHSWLERSLGVILPESANGLISQVIFMFEYNFRHGTVIGIVGAGGIGYYINLYLKFLQYDKVIAYLIIIFVVVLLIDQLSIIARSFFTEDSNISRSSWLSIFLPAAMSSNQS